MEFQDIITYIAIFIGLFVGIIALIILYSFITGTFVPTNFDSIFGDGSWDKFLSILSFSM